MTKSLVDNFNFELFGHTGNPKIPEFKGYISSIDPTTAGVGVLIGGSQNTHKTLLGTIKVRDGLKLRGTPDSALAGVTSSYEWYDSSGDILPLRVLLDQSGNTKLQVESDIADGSTLVWYDLLTNQTSTRFVFDTWWNDGIQQDVLIFVLGDDNLFAWSGAIGKLLSTTANTITLTASAASQRFALAASNLVINGNVYAYTSVSGAVFSGVSPNPTGEAAGSIVLEEVETTATTPQTGFDNDFIKVIGNQLHVGSYTSPLIFVSAASDFHDFSVPTPRVPGDADLLTLDSQSRGITVQKGSTDRSGNAVISGGLGDWYTVLRENITVGAVLTEQVTVIRSQTADLATALAHEFIDLVGDTIIFLDQNNQLREFGLVRNIVQPVYPLLSLDVYTELKGRDFTGGALRVIADQGDTTIYITAPREGIDYMYQIRQKLDTVGNLGAERIWHPPQIRNISRVALIDGVTYGYSTSNPQMYQLWDTGQFTDDSPSGDPLPYECHAIFAYLSGAVRTQQVFFDKIYYEGYMTQGTVLYNNVYFEYQGSKNILTVRVNKPTDPGKKLAKFYSSVATPSLGDVSLGEIPLGEGIQATGGNNPPKFRAIRHIQPIDVFEFALDLASYDLDCNWELLVLGVNLESTTRRPVVIMG